MIEVGKSLRTGLEIFGGIDNGVRIVVVLDDFQESLDRIAFSPQAIDLFIDAGHGKQHLNGLP